MDHLVHNNQQNSYDQVPYGNLSHSTTHPDEMATIAMLFGMRPAAVDACRVLELGCASGGNLIPMACTLPNSTFVGVDYAARQIDEGQQIIDALGLKNITLKEQDVKEIGPQWGQFDYIIAHGLYSWVPADVRDHVLRICKQNLAPQGIAFVSYNAKPGGYMVSIIRDMMLYHGRGENDPIQRVQKAREIVQFATNAAPNSNPAFRAFLDRYNKTLNKQGDASKGGDDSLILHDELSEYHSSFYFEQFVKHAGCHGLQYLSESQYSRTEPNDLLPEATETLETWAQNRIEFEQYMDLIQCRSFRLTLLCHKEITLRRKIKPQDMLPLYVAANIRPTAAKPDLYAVVPEGFCNQEGMTITIEHPVSKVALLHLGQLWPQAIRVDQLLSWARKQVRLNGRGQNRDIDLEALANTLLMAYGHSSKLLELHMHYPSFASEANDRPLAFPAARLQASIQSTVTNTRHERNNLDPLSRYLLQHLDGDHDRATLLEDLDREPITREWLGLDKTNRFQTASTEFTRLLKQEIDVRLDWLAYHAFLIEPAPDGIG